MKNTNSQLVLAVLMLCATTAAAAADTFGLGTGRDGVLTVTAPGTVINRYTQVVGPLAPGDTLLFVSSTEGFAAGDLVMVLQTTGIVPEPARGDPGPIDLSSDPVGRWELARVLSVSGRELALGAPLLHSYAGLVTQVIRVPEYVEVTIQPGASLVATPWDGRQGGVLAFLASGSIHNEGEVQASGAGFRAGLVGQESREFIGCSTLPASVRPAAGGGEGISFLDFGVLATGFGNASNGGGGGICPMSGGGGGGNGAAGGHGGDSLTYLDSARGIGGRGGAELVYSMLDHLTFGGGGGRGYGMEGRAQAGAGGGAIFIRGYRLTGAGTLAANGLAGDDALQGGAGGGGAGGSISLRIEDSAECGLISARGGAGGSIPTEALEHAGPGGGGGGGRVLYQAGNLQLCPISVEAGLAGDWQLEGTAAGLGSGAQPTASQLFAHRGTITRLEGGFMPYASCGPPVPVFRKPIDGQVVNTGTPMIEVELADNNVDHVTIYVGSSDILGHNATLDTAANRWKYTVSPALAESSSSYPIDAVAFCQNGSFQRSEINIYIDVTPPETVLVDKPTNPSTSNSATFSFKATNDSRTVSFKCWVDNQPEASCGTAGPDTLVSVNFSNLSEGSHAFNVYAVDAAGNVDASPASYTWSVQVLPDTTIDEASKPPNPSKSSSASFVFTASRPVTGYECQLDSQPYASCVSPTNYTSLPDGSHTFSVRAKDAVGVDPTPATYTWVVDTVPPETLIDQRPPDPSNSASATFVFSATGGASGFECKLDSQPYVNCTSPVTYAGLADASHTFSVKARDAAGNVDPSPASYTWVVDTVPPETQIDQKPPDPSNSASATFVFSGIGGASGFECKLDSQPYAGCTSPVTLSGLANASHTFSVRAKDAAGNVDPTPATYTWEVDTVPPDTTFTQKPSNPSNLTAVTFAFSGAGAGGRYWCRLDGGAEYSCDSGSDSLSGLTEGVHTYCVAAQDAATNRDASPACHTWVIDLAEPDTVIGSRPANPTNSTSAAFTFSGGGTGGKYWCSLDGGVEVSCDTGSQSYTGLQEAVHTFCVAAQDAAGNKDSSAACYSWVIDRTAPDTLIGAATKPPNPSSSTTATFIFSGAGPEGKYWCRMDGGTENPCDGGSQTYAGLTEGMHTFCVAAQDAAGNKDATPACYTWEIDLTAPETVIDPASKPPNPTNVTSATFSFSGGGTGGQYRCKLDQNPEEVCNFGSRPYSGLMEGTHTFCVAAIDEAGNRDQSPDCYTWVVDVTPPDTTIEETSKPRNPTNVTSVTFRFSGAGSGGKYYCKLDTESPTSCDSGTVTYNPLSEGGHTFSVYAQDAAGNKDEQTPATYSWVVDVTEPETVIDEASKPSSPTNKTSAAFKFGDAGPGGKYWCQLDLDVYRPCDSGSQSYQNLAPGSHTFSVYAEDAAGNVDPSPATHTWVVDVTVPETVIDPTSKPPNPTNATSATFRFSGAGDGGRYRCKLDIAAEEACDPGLKDYTNLGDAPHTFCVYAVDAAGNADPTPDCYTWRVDVTPPDTAIDEASKPLNPTNNPSVAFTFTGSGEAVAFWCKLDGGPLEDCSAGSFIRSNVAEGSHLFCVYARDAAGNDDPAPACHSWVVDLTPPITTIDSKPRNPINDRTATFQFSGAGGGGIYWCKLDTGTAVECASPHTYSNLTEDSHTFCVYAVDAAGNADESPECYSWLVDVTAPDTVIDEQSKPKNPTNQTTVTFTFTGAGPGEEYLCTLDSGPEESCDDGTKTYTDLTERSHIFQVRSRDQARNADASPATYPWRVDLTPPSALVTNPFKEKPRTNKKSPLFTGTTSEALSQVRLFINNLDTEENVISSSSGTWELQTAKGLPDGEHTVWVRAIDLAGNEGALSQSLTFIVDTRPPDTDFSTTPPKIHNSRWVFFAFKTPGESPEEKMTFECTVEALKTKKKVDGGCSGSRQDINLYDLFGEDLNGDYELLVSARDEAGNLDESPAPFTWKVIIDPPGPPEILTPADGDMVHDLTPTISGKAVAKGTVRLFSGDTEIGLVQVDAEGLWTFKFPEALNEQDYSLHGVATDEARNPSAPSKPISFTVVAPRPVAHAIGGGIGCATSGGSTWLSLLGLLAGAVWNSRRRR